MGRGAGRRAPGVGGAHAGRRKGGRRGRRKRRGTPFDRIPYLNGGLFDVLQEDNASDTIDDAKLSVPNRLFYATDADECRVFLSMLGIGPAKLEA